MITSLRLVDFKNFANETLRVGPFTVIVGANASGKSNIRDAFRFLHGIGRGYSLAEILGGKHGVGGQIEWNGIRGAATEVIRFEKTAFSLQVRLPGYAYRIDVGSDTTRPGMFRVIREALTRTSGYGSGNAIYTTHPEWPDPVRDQGDDLNLFLRMEKTGSQRKYGDRISMRPDQPALTQLREHRRVVRRHKEHAEQVTEALAQMRFLDLIPELMRQPAFPGQVMLGDSGENLPTVLREICADPTRKETLASWTRELTPMDVVDFEFPTDPLTGRVQLAIKEKNNRTVSAYGASDGTLRFLAMLAALLGENSAGLYFFEEIDNGIHPSRMHLLLNLIEGITAKGAVRVVTTTHSPELLTLVNDQTFGSTSVVYRDENADDGIIRPVTELPKAGELRKSQGLGRLHTSGWMEDALAFTAGIA